MATTPEKLQTPSPLLDRRPKDLGDGRGEMLSQVRSLPNESQAKK